MSNILIGVIYVIIDYLTTDLTFVIFNLQTNVSTPATAFFPSAGIAIAFSLYTGSWIMLLLGIDTFFQTIQHGRPLWNIIILPLATIIWYGGAIEILKHSIKINPHFQKMKDIFSFLLVTAIGAIGLAVTMGLAMVVFENGSFQFFISFAFTWFIGDIVGIYSISPLLLLFIFPLLDDYWNKRFLVQLNKRKIVETFFLFSIITIFTIIVYGSIQNNLATLLFLFFIPLTVIALLFGLKGAVLAEDLIILQSLIVLKFITLNTALIEFQVFVFSLACVSLIIGIIVDERNDLIHKLMDKNVTVENLVKEKTYQLNEANKDLEFFSYSVSHDLRIPLQSITMFTNLLTKNDVTQQEIENLATKIDDKSKAMDNLIALLLNFFKIGNQDVNKIDVNMKNVIEKAYNQIFDYKNNTSLKFILNDSFPSSYCDPSLLEIVWVNLLSNALKYSSKTEEPIIKVDYFKNESEKIVYFIQDNGIGFDIKNSNKLFHPFVRLHNEQEYPGNGIGLALVKKIITRHGGTIWASSEYGRGTTFFFTL